MFSPVCKCLHFTPFLHWKNCLKNQKKNVQGTLGKLQKCSFQDSQWNAVEYKGANKAALQWQQECCCTAVLATWCPTAQILAKKKSRKGFWAEHSFKPRTNLEILQKCIYNLLQILCTYLWSQLLQCNVRIYWDDVALFLSAGKRVHKRNIFEHPVWWSWLSASLTILQFAAKLQSCISFRSKTISRYWQT